MDIDPPLHPRPSTLQRKRTWNSLSEATSSLALSTPTLDTHHQTGDNYFPSPSPAQSRPSSPSKRLRSSTPRLRNDESAALGLGMDDVLDGELPVRRAPGRVRQVLLAAGALLGVSPDDCEARFAAGAVVLVDSSSRVRLALPLGDVDVLAAREGDDAARQALGTALRSAVEYLEQEKLWLLQDSRVEMRD
ncbi:hypothetical protein ANO11243_068350 [Dothideomycetidae sp. 11243]|nr:hypothetical protein ANO11243_068350 [fungal sp. No.11243]